MSDREWEPEDGDLRDLGGSLQGARSTVEALSAELRDMSRRASETQREVKGLSEGLSKGLKTAFDGMVFEGKRMSDALRGIGKSVFNHVYTAATQPVANKLGGAVAGGVESLMGSILPFQAGGVLTQGRPTPFARGGVVDAPTLFPMRGGTGLMGEAGPEAILPLARGADGRLGVKGGTGGARPVQVNVNISTPDIEGFRRSRAQVAAELGRAVGRGQRIR